MSILKSILVGLLLVLCIPAMTHSDQVLPVQKPVEEKQLTVIDMADKYAMQYGVDASVLKKVMYCESQNKPNPKGYNDGGRAFGIMQFHKQTFQGYSKKLGEDLDYYSYHDQIKLAAYMFSIGQQRHWTCYDKVMRA